MPRPLYTAFVFSLLIVGCSQTTEPTAPGNTDPVALRGPDWVLQKIDGVPTTPSTHPGTTLHFRDSTYGGFGPVNSYWGLYQAGNGTLRIGRPGSEQIFSTGPDGIAETEYFESLSGVTGFEVRGGLLILSYGTDGRLEYTAR